MRCLGLLVFSKESSHDFKLQCMQAPTVSHLKASGLPFRLLCWHGLDKKRVEGRICSPLQAPEHGKSFSKASSTGGLLLFW